MTHAVVTYIRGNPFTIGHEHLVKQMNKHEIAEKWIYLSPSSGTQDNPLDFDYRYELAKTAFNGVSTYVSQTQHKDFFEMLKFVGQVGFSELTVVVGSDRFEEINKRVNMYNGKLYFFPTIRVKNAGTRNEGADGLEGMSASKMREAAVLGDYEFFESGLPTKLRPRASEIYLKVREACLTKEILI